MKTVFRENKIFSGSYKSWKHPSELSRVITRLLHVFFMISHSVSPRAQSWKNHVITYIYWTKKTPNKCFIISKETINSN